MSIITKYAKPLVCLKTDYFKHAGKRGCITVGRDSTEHSITFPAGDPTEFPHCVNVHPCGPVSPLVKLIVANNDNGDAMHYLLLL